MAPKFTMISRLVACLLLLFATYGTYAKSHDITTGMSIENALLVAKKCVIEAANFKDPRMPPRKARELRAQDSLEFAGVTDTARLNALRRYIIRNTLIGVPSIWGVATGKNFATPYLLRGSTLDKIDKTWTIEKLALEIAANAGLPFLKYKTVSQMIANCRHDAISPPRGLKAIATPVPTPDAAPTPTPTPLTVKIRNDLADDEKILNAFSACLQNEGQRGLKSAGIVDGEGDYYRYEIKDFNIDLTELLANRDKSYEDLFTYLHKNAYVPVSPDLTARIIVMNFAISVVVPGCQRISFPISRLCQYPSERSDDELNEVQTKNSKFLLDRDTTLGAVKGLSTVKVKESNLYALIITYKELRAFKRKQNSQSQEIPPELQTINLDDSRKLVDIIDEVTNKLDKERK